MEDLDPHPDLATNPTPTRSDAKSPITPGSGSPDGPGRSAVNQVGPVAGAGGSADAGPRVVSEIPSTASAATAPPRSRVLMLCNPPRW